MQLTQRITQGPAALRYRRQVALHARYCVSVPWVASGAVLASGALPLVAAGLALTRYRVAKPGEYLARTGLGLGDAINIQKQAFLGPFQTLVRISLEPFTLRIVVEKVMSKEMIAFNLPTMFTIGPKDDPMALQLYAKLLAQSKVEDVREKIRGIVHGEVRIACGATRLDDIFNNRNLFKELIVDKIAPPLADFGLYIYNANIEELEDMNESKYFYHLRQRALENAQAAARIAIAETKRQSDIGTAENEAITRKQLAQLEKEAKLIENERLRDVAESDSQLQVARNQFENIQKMARVEGTAAAEKRELDLQREVEEARNRQEVERLRASTLAQAIVDAQIKVCNAKAEADSLIFLIEGKAQEVKSMAAAESDAVRIRADAAYAKKEQEASGLLRIREAEASGVQKLREAEAEGLTKLLAAAGTVDRLNSYTMVRDGVLSQIAKEQSRAVQGLNPHITVSNWQAGPDSGNTLSDVMQDVVRAAVPLVEHLKTNTGVDLLNRYRGKGD